jgi:hypothetical protein
MNTNRSWAVLSIALFTLLISVSCVLFWRGGGALKFEPDELPKAKLGEAYKAEIHISENITPVGDFSIAKDALPAGLQLVRVEGEDIARISGIPEEVGTFRFSIRVWCYGTNVSGQEGEKEYSLVVEE